MSSPRSWMLSGREHLAAGVASLGGPRDGDLGAGKRLGELHAQVGRDLVDAALALARARELHEHLALVDLLLGPVPTLMRRCSRLGDLVGDELGDLLAAPVSGVDARCPLAGRRRRPSRRCPWRAGTPCGMKPPRPSATTRAHDADGRRSRPRWSSAQRDASGGSPVDHVEPARRPGARACPGCGGRAGAPTPWASG